MPIKAVRVNISTSEVDNFFNFANATALLQANVQAGSDFRWIGETDWAPEQNPANGDIWSGTIPATFAPRQPAEDDNPPKTTEEAFARIAAAQEALSIAVAQAAALVPLAAFA